MARFWMMSDIHADVMVYDLPPAPPEVDAVIIAGDIRSRLRGTSGSLAWLEKRVDRFGVPIV